MTHLLELAGVSKRFGGVQAVSGVDFHADPGEIVGVIGPNGAGKTTLFNIVTGFYSPDEGTMIFDGNNISGLKPNALTRLGMARTFQSVRLFNAMTVLENAMVGQHTRTKAGLFGALSRGRRNTQRRGNDHREGSSRVGLLRRPSGQATRSNWPRAWLTPIGAGWRSPGQWPPSRNCSCSTNLRPA